MAKTDAKANVENVADDAVVQNTTAPATEDASTKGNRGYTKLMTGMKAKFAKCKRVTIKVPVDNLNPKDTEVVVSINGYVFQIQRGKEVGVPLPVKKLLERAKYI